MRMKKVRAAVWGKTCTNIRCHRLDLPKEIRNTDWGLSLNIAWTVSSGCGVRRADEHWKSFMPLLPSVTGSSCASCLLIHQRPQMEHSVDTGPNNPEQYHLSIGGRQDKCIAFFPTHLSPLFIPLLLPRLLFILMWSGWSSWWWHGVDYAVPTVTYSKAAEEGTIVASDLWMTALPVAPAPHWRAHGERGAGRARRDAYSTCQGLTDMGFWRETPIPGHLAWACWLSVVLC